MAYQQMIPPAQQSGAGKTVKGTQAGNCVYCGQQFLKNTARQNFCSNKHMTLFYSRKYEGNLKEPIHGICERCGSGFVDFKIPPSKYCSLHCSVPTQCDLCGAYTGGSVKYVNRYGAFCSQKCLKYGSFYMALGKAKKGKRKVEEERQRKKIINANSIWVYDTEKIVRVGSNALYYRTERKRDGETN